MNTLLRPAVLAAALCLAAAACSPTLDVRGNIPDSDALARITPGKTTRDEVQTLLGTPSATSVFGDESWQYISAKSETVAFFKPKFTERTVISITFSRDGVVKDVAARGLEDGQDLELVDRETPTAGKELNILEQLLGNVGRFSKEAK
ncbi:outer membrane protein assembly factor BamE [Magnetospirillum sp. UT-4]|uniref:outer membrane protein assembly factor BamE n=1 Tax=Magnetospirillum sp. UT-4 TaxID=2681467 RepID=UPI00137ED2CB|nr:outer membrane protein assembly factor BamE [Magnetospirillum sp. UT-4]CAA7617834.1 Small protein A (TmRNA-binding) [Magnetospirillum sp. UT-4]